MAAQELLAFVANRTIRAVGPMVATAAAVVTFISA
jgi:hypothetical protein